jgi:tetratricopeptide (TPR) repeat protein
MPEQTKKSLILSIYFALAVSTLLVFWQVRNFDFVNYDDDIYVYENPHVLNGLTPAAVSWAFTTDVSSHWHPLTWISLMLDCQLFGLNPAGFHLVNLLLHIVNTLLLFAVLKKMTGSLWPSAFVAAAFALHPMHVESVAWISEHKDVLSAFFWMLTMLAYAQYVKKPGIVRYLLVILIFALGLMAKPMLVTLPFVFLLLDYWPLDRIKHFNRQNIYRLVLEKIPFFALVAVSSVVTFMMMRSGDTVIKMDTFPLNSRIANAVLSYVRYLYKMVWPQNLAAFYPLNAAASFSFWPVAMCVLLLFVISIFVIQFGRKQKYLPVGWLWFVGTLIPVIGIVQVGAQAYADRYTYVPYIGLFIMIAWGLPALLSKWTSTNSVESPQRKIALGLSMVIVLTTLGICAHRQTSYWKNSVTLFSHAIEVTQNNHLAYNNLGNAYAILGRLPEAMDDFRRAIKIKPDYAEPQDALGVAYARLGRYAEAIEASKLAIKIKPDLADAHENLGNAYCGLGRYPDAVESYKQAIGIKPDNAGTHYNLGNTYTALGRLPEAIEAFSQAVKIKPDYAEAYTNLGIVYRRLGRFTDAIDAYKQAIKIKPDLAETHYNLGIAYLAMGDKNSAMAEYNILKYLNSEMADKLFNQINK